MKPVMQTLFGPEDGDCFRACLASIFDRDIETVPHFCRKGNEPWSTDTQAWLAHEYGLGLLSTMPIEAIEGLPKDSFIATLFTLPCHHLIIGRSPRGISHSVVGLSGKIIHDPHPDNLGLVEVQTWEFFVKL
ncbi:MAG: hypothetical protein A4E69_00272 [Syntrophus sp. PtaB.Bin138]|nr:MAG: hypothetical protein A4E69_00272 [Syntrophus sp. PtaB.Bin138]